SINQFERHREPASSSLFISATAQTSLPQASSSPPQIIASVSDHRTISVVFLCRRRHARIQTSPMCSSSRPLSHYKRYQSNNGDFLYFATQAPNLWIFSN
ncbi:unnamed protein product, partial [Brassica rapa]